MDGISALLDGPRARGAFLLRSVLVAPWSLEVADRAPLSLVAVVRGQAWIRCSGADPVLADTGSVALLRGPDPYVVSDAVSTAPQAVIHPDQRCTSVDGGELHWQRGTGVRTWGNVDPDRAPAESTVLMTGTYTDIGDLGRGLLAGLPSLVLVPYAEATAPAVDLLLAESARDQPGQEAVLDRLLDLVLVSTLRTWFDRGDTAPGWIAAWSDPTIGRVLQLMQHEPERPWTLEGLAGEVGMSRAGLARRFTLLVGRPPMSFLTDWRLDLAADLLVSTDATLEEIARRVGYSGAFALSTAFRRERGLSPRAHRARGRTDQLRGIPRSPAAAPTSTSPR